MAEPPVAGLTLTPAFKLIFISVLVISLLSLGMSFYFALLEKPTALGNTLFDTCSTIAKMGFGAIIGLIGGKAVS